MADTENQQEEPQDESVRVYEVGYHILSTVPEEALEGVVAEIRSLISDAKGSLIAEGAPQAMKLSYPMYVSKGGKNTKYDRASFGWIKFEIAADQIAGILSQLEKNENILRSILFQTVREDTRAHIRPTVLQEIKRTDTIQSTPRKGAETEAEGEVSEEALDKSIQELIAE